MAVHRDLLRLCPPLEGKSKLYRAVSLNIRSFFLSNWPEQSRAKIVQIPPLIAQGGRARLAAPARPPVTDYSL